MRGHPSSTAGRAVGGHHGAVSSGEKWSHQCFRNFSVTGTMRFKRRRRTNLEESKPIKVVTVVYPRMWRDQ
jgi:hypothetical protein